MQRAEVFGADAPDVRCATIVPIWTEPVFEAEEDVRSTLERQHIGDSCVLHTRKLRETGEHGLEEALSRRRRWIPLRRYLDSKRQDLRRIESWPDAGQSSEALECQRGSDQEH